MAKEKDILRYEKMNGAEKVTNYFSNDYQNLW